MDFSSQGLLLAASLASCCEAATAYAQLRLESTGISGLRMVLGMI